LQDLVTRVQVDFHVGTLARRLLRSYPSIQKPQDGIHLATALLYNVDELHTFDRKNLTDLSGKIERKDGKKLKICSLPKRPRPPVATGDLFDNVVQKTDAPSRRAPTASERRWGSRMIFCPSRVLPAAMKTVLRLRRSLERLRRQKSQIGS
jgi:hypothetical protein